MTENGDKTVRDRTVSDCSDRSEPDVEPHFSPIITLPEVVVSTNEENEDVLLKIRAKLYRFDTHNDDGPEWKERGTGELKLLRHKDNNSVRIVMRRDKTLKVCANHFITPWMELKPSVGSDKAFVYTVAADFADEQIKTECLAVRFGNVEHANQFKEKFNEAKHIVTTQCKLYNSENEDSDEDSETNSESEKEDVPQKNASKEETEVTKQLAELAVTNSKSESVDEI